MSLLDEVKREPKEWRSFSLLEDICLSWSLKLEFLELGGVLSGDPVGVRLFPP